MRCDDCPFVYTHVIAHKQENGETKNCLAYNHAGELLTLAFEPQKIFMLPETGRVYHPAPERVGYVGLVRSKLAIEFSKSFVFDDGEQKPPTRFKWDGEEFVLNNSWYYEVCNKKSQKATLL